MTKFTKMHGCGNDYVYINGAECGLSIEDKPTFVRKVSDRHMGIGSDGVIFINPSEVADFEMEMWNSDGTRAQMCGNGIRCVGKYVYDKGLTTKEQITVVSAGAIKVLDFTVEDGKVVLVKVDMGAPILEAMKIPVLSEKAEVIEEAIEVNGVKYEMTCVSMGNPHAVVFVEDTELMSAFDIEKIGPMFESHKRFPERVNTEFVRVVDKKTVQMRVWERGAGETLACGTGACATAVAAILTGRTDTSIEVQLLGGSLFIEWDREENTVVMTGPATTVFEGEI
ncbi:MAG: diaminopimelate epimerase [Lachnospiraceae bacterium]